MSFTCNDNDEGAFRFRIRGVVGTSIAEVIKDNADPTGVTLTGTWSSGSHSDVWGGGYRHDGNSGKGTKSVTFTPSLGAGSYQVYLWHVAGTDRDNNVPVDVVHAGGTSTVTVNQQINGARWNLLGTYPFNTGTGGYVRVRTTGTSGYVIADAVRFVKASTTSALGTSGAGNASAERF